MILIRADANEQIGTGHVMRCRSIACSFVNHGEEVLFVTADHKGDKLIGGIPSVCLDSVWDNMGLEVEKLKFLVKERKATLLLIDSYYITEDYINALSEQVQIAYIDDLNASCWNIDFLINYNIFSYVFDYSKYQRSKTKFLLGPQYAPLRTEFMNLPEFNIRHVTNILVSAGGADPEHIIEKMMEQICPKNPDIKFHFIVGALNPRLENIKEMKRKNIVLHINEKNMARLMMKCDVAISAAGTTLYELCAVGIPTVTYTLADNQLVAADQFDKQGIMISVGDCRGDLNFISGVEKVMDELTQDSDKRRELSYKMKQLVDGNGASRIVEAICR